MSSEAALARTGALLKDFISTSCVYNVVEAVALDLIDLT